MYFPKYINKPILYKHISNKIKNLGYSFSDYPLESLKIAYQQPNLSIEKIQFNSTKIGGILYKGEKNSSMALNSARSLKGQNFDCMHELIHYWFHPPGERFCIDDNKIIRNSSIEWQANEGAAEALMPYKLFIPKLFEYKGDIQKLSDFFFVGELSVKYRIDNLEPEIFQYMHGIPINRIIVIQKARKKDNFFDDTSVKISNEDFIKLVKAQIWYCPNCDNTDVGPEDVYCKICGENLTFSLWGGINNMKYREGVPLDETNTAMICPRCENEEIEPQDEYCKICGTYLIQECADKIEENGWGESYTEKKSCGYKPASNARFCPMCGNPTTFYLQGLLKDWEEEKKEIETEEDPGYVPF